MNDEPFKLKIEVTAEHIRDGARLECSHCPIALAIEAAWPAAERGEVEFLPYGRGARRIYAGHASLEVFVAGQCWQAPTPSKAAKFIDTFDKRLPVEPFAFEAKFWILDSATRILDGVTRSPV